MFSTVNGGETGIRTLGTLARTTVFETAPFDHSGTSPQMFRSIQIERRIPYREWSNLIQVKAAPQGGQLAIGGAFYPLLRLTLRVISTYMPPDCGAETLCALFFRANSQDTSWPARNQTGNQTDKKTGWPPAYAQHGQDPVTEHRKERKCSQSSKPVANSIVLPPKMS